MLLEGLQLPLTTPFYPDGRLNVRKLEHNVARYSKTPANGLVALSDVGEPTMLSDEETRLALRCVLEASEAEKVLVAGVSRDSVVGTIDLCQYAAELGYDAVLVKPPSVVGAGARVAREKQLLTYFQAIADSSPVPVVLYCTQSTGVLSFEVVAELSGHPQILGMVDGVGGPAQVAAFKARTASIRRNVAVTAVFAAVTGRMLIADGAQLEGGMISADNLIGEGTAVATLTSKPQLKTRTKTVGFQILTANTASMLDDLLVGAAGAMPAFAASAPQACYEVLAAWKDGDEGLAREKQIRLLEAVRRVEIEFGVAGIKYGCDLNGYFGGIARLPTLPLDGNQRAEIEALMHSLRA